METWVIVVIFLIAIAGIAGAGYGVYRLARLVGNQKTGIRAYAWANIISLFVGAAISGLAAIILWIALSWFLGHFFPIRKFPVAGFFLRHTVSFALGVFTAYTFIFLPGITQEVQPGQKAYMKLFGIPFGKFGVGYAWIFKPFMEFVVDNTVAHQDTEEGVVEYLSENGMEVMVESESTYSIDDLLESRGIQALSIPDYVKSVRRASVREWIGNRHVDLSTALNPNPTLQEQVDSALRINGLKGQISSDGPTEVKRLMNEKLEEYGLKVSQVQFNQVLFNDRVEQSAQRLFEELLQAGGLGRDAANKVQVMKTLVDGILANAGIQPDQLTPAQRLALWDKGFARAMAMEGQGGYNYTDLGGNPPGGVIVSTPPSQPTSGGTSS